jgi:MFS family permease
MDQPQPPTPLWKQRNFMLLWYGQLVSWMGTEVSGIALPLVVLALTGSPAQAGRVAAIRGLAYVFWAIPAGTLIDRWDRRTVMFVANLGSGLAMGSIALALALHKLSVIQLYITGAIEGSFFVFANLGRIASATRIAPKEQFPAVSAQFGVAESIATLAGPPLGGFLYQAAGAFLAFLADALSYFINAFSIFFITVSLGPDAPSERKAMHHEIREALVWYWQQPLLFFLNLLSAGRVLLTAGVYLVIIVLAKEHHASPMSIGFIFTAGAGGSLFGSLISAKIYHRFKMKQLLTGIALYNCLIFGLYAFAANNFLLAAVTVLLYAADPLQHTTTSSYSAKIIPDNIRGRVVSLTRLIVLGAHSFGFFITGTLLQYVGDQWTIGVLSCLLFVLFLATLFSKKLSEV